MSTLWYFLTCVLVFISMGPTSVRAENGFVHVSRGITSCVVANTPTNTIIRNSKTQYNIAFMWTYKRGIQSWAMSSWAPAADFAEHAKSLVLQGAPPPGHSGIQQATISYTTKMRLPSVLKSLINPDQTLNIRKSMYAVGDRVYTFVNIIDVPFIENISIDTVMTFYGNRRVISQHHVSYAKFPWILKWASGILKREIVKSIERMDMLGEQMYCPRSGLFQ